MEQAGIARKLGANSNILKIVSDVKWHASS